MNNKVRHHELDLLKVIAIFSVCIYHFWYGLDYGISQITDTLQDFFYPFLSTCVPLFFAVNGALLLNRETFDARKHYKSMLLLVAQFLIWRAVTIFILGRLIGFDFAALGKTGLINIFLLQVPPADIKINHLWFIPALFCVYLLYPFLKSIFSRERTDPNARTALIVLLIFTYLYNFLLHDFDCFKYLSPKLSELQTVSLDAFEPFSMYIGTMSTYFLLGGLLHKYHEKLRKLPVLISILMLIIGMTLSYAAVRLKDTLSWSYDPVFEGYNTTGTLLCTIGCFLLAGRINFHFLEKAKLMPILLSISANTMSIYYTHWILGCILAHFFVFPTGPVWNILHATILVAAGTLFGLLVKRIPVLKYLMTR